tara:strand:- start:2621 stop:2872 length:252 start_codon:yes stop_codon:yes gene_type:complete
MKNLLITLLVLFSLTANAQQRGQRTAQTANKCIHTKIVEKEKVTVTTINKCNNTKTIKVYTKEEWEKIQKQRRERLKKRRGGN